MVDTFQNWIGRTTTRHDVVSERLLAEYRATLKGYLFEGGAHAPPGFHFGLAPALPEPSQLGADGAEAKGLFLPPIPYPRRMWAGGRIETLQPVRLGQNIMRRSALSDISHREGKAGAFYLVSVTHEIAADGVLALRERQDLVFRAGGMGASPGTPATTESPALSWHVDASAALLFRYSAFTFNGHRIHYDLDFARREEGYAGLLVHGPLQATLLLNQISVVLGRVPQVFDYRCLAPLTSGQVFDVEALGNGIVRIVDARGIKTSEGRVPETV
jgi:3-methylfumaryl-CoA hydratase